jgi:hypothetical protein
MIEAHTNRAIAQVYAMRCQEAMDRGDIFTLTKYALLFEHYCSAAELIYLQAQMHRPEISATFTHIRYINPNHLK